MPEDKLNKLKELLKTVNDGLSKEEFVSAFKAVVAQVKALEAEMIKTVGTRLSKADTDFNGMVAQMKEMRQAFEQAIQETRKANDSSFSALKTRAMESITAMMAKMDIQGKMDAMYEEHEAMMQKMETEIPDTEKMMAEMMAKIPHDTAEQVRDKLETLKDNERLDVSAVKGLEDEIKALRKEIATKTSGVRRIFQPYVDDFSAQTNGSLKTFILSREPLRTNTVQVFGTDFPTILRPTTDFTVSGRNLTLTSAVPAPNVGATLLAHYFA